MAIAKKVAAKKLPAKKSKPVPAKKAAGKAPAVPRQDPGKVKAEPAPVKPKRVRPKTKTVAEGRKSRAVIGGLKAGQPTKYDPALCEAVTSFCMLGATENQIADFLGVSVQTLYDWRARHPEFLEALRAGKEQADARVARALYQRAIGYSHPEDDIRTLGIGGGVSEIVITPTIKHYPPEVGAMTMWLKNRRPDLWRDKVEVELDDVSGFSPEEIAERNERMAKLRAEGFWVKQKIEMEARALRLENAK